MAGAGSWTRRIAFSHGIYGNVGSWKRRIFDGSNSMTLNFIQPGNTLTMASIDNPASWFVAEVAFTLELADDNVMNFAWVTDHWGAVNPVFSDANGSATLRQGENSSQVGYTNAET